MNVEFPLIIFIFLLEQHRADQRRPWTPAILEEMEMLYRPLGISLSSDTLVLMRYF